MSKDHWYIDYAPSARADFWQNAFLEFVKAGHTSGAAIAYADEALRALKEREGSSFFKSNADDE